MTRAARPAPSAPLPSRAEVPPLRCTGASVRRLARRMTAFYELHLQPAGLKLSQYSLLAHLSDEPPSLLALSRRLEMDRTTLTRNLQPLLAKRWVAEVAGTDARQRLFVLTASGARVRNQAREAWRRAQAELEKRLGSEFLARLHRALDRALMRLKALLPDEN